MNWIAETHGHKPPFQGKRGKANAPAGSGEGPGRVSGAGVDGNEEALEMEDAEEDDDDDDDDDAMDGQGPSASVASLKGAEHEGIPDMAWLQAAIENERKDTSRLSIELTGYMSNLIKESIRVSPHWRFFLPYSVLYRTYRTERFINLMAAHISGVCKLVGQVR